MIRKTLIAAASLFILWNIFLFLFAPKLYTGLLQQNTIKAQEYLYERQGTPVVILGTSLSARISQDLIKDSVYNLSLMSGSILTGLEILKKCPRKPHLLLIESN